VQLGPHELVDIGFSEDFSVLLLRPNPQTGLRTEQTFTDTLVKQSRQKLKLIRAMRQGKLKRSPPVGSLVLPDITGHIMPAKSLTRLSAINELKSDSLHRTDTLLSDSNPKPRTDNTATFFGLGPLNQSSPLEKQVFISYYESVFGRPHARGDIYKVHAQHPKDITAMDARQRKHEYKRLIKKGREEDVIAYAVNEEPNQPRKPPTFKQIQCDISSKNVDSYYASVKLIDDSIAQAKKQSRYLLAQAVQLGRSTQALKNQALKTRQKTQSLGRLADLALFGRKDLKKSETSEDSSHLDSDPKADLPVASLNGSHASVSYEARRSKVLHQRDLSLDSKRQTLLTMSRLKDPTHNPEDQKHFSQLLRQTSEAQQAVLLLKLVNFLRLLDGLRMARTPRLTRPGRKARSAPAPALPNAARTSESEPQQESLGEAASRPGTLRENHSPLRGPATARNRAAESAAL